MSAARRASIELPGADRCKRDGGGDRQPDGLGVVDVAPAAREQRARPTRQLGGAAGIAGNQRQPSDLELHVDVVMSQSA